MPPFEPEPEEEQASHSAAKRRRFDHTTGGIYEVIQAEADRKGTVTFDRVFTAAHEKTDKSVSARKTAARAFQSMLLLVREGKVELDQKKPFEPITATCQ